MKKRACTLLFIAALLLGCEAVGDPDPSYREGALLDVNDTSPTFNQYVLPEDYSGFISAWYFGHST